MSSFEKLHPRGKPGNAGQFRNKDVDDTPSGLAALAAEADPERPELELCGDWIVEHVEGCTCGADSGYYGAHEPGCGTEPVRFVGDLDDVERQAALEIERDRADGMIDEGAAEWLRRQGATNPDGRRCARCDYPLENDACVSPGCSLFDDVAGQAAARAAEHRRLVRLDTLATQVQDVERHVADTDRRPAEHLDRDLENPGDRWGPATTVYADGVRVRSDRDGLVRYGTCIGHVPPSRPLLNQTGRQRILFDDGTWDDVPPHRVTRADDETTEEARP